jgi:hypothetical protein
LGAQLVVRLRLSPVEDDEPVARVVAVDRHPSLRTLVWHAQPPETVLAPAALADETVTEVKDARDA